MLGQHDRNRTPVGRQPVVAQLREQQALLLTVVEGVDEQSEEGDASVGGAEVEIGPAFRRGHDVVEDPRHLQDQLVLLAQTPGGGFLAHGCIVGHPVWNVRFGVSVMSRLFLKSGNARHALDYSRALERSFWENRCPNAIPGG